MELDGEELKESLIGAGALGNSAEAHTRQAWEREDWYELQAAAMMGIPATELQHTKVKDYMQGWRDSDWMSGTKRRERWRCQLSRRLTQAESAVIATAFNANAIDTLEQFLHYIPKNVLVVKMRQTKGPLV